MSTTQPTTELPITEMIDKNLNSCQEARRPSMNESFNSYARGWEDGIKDILPQVRTLEISLIEKANNVNEFIRDIAKLFGEDDLGKDGKSWSIDDFSDAIEKAKEDERNRIVGILEEKLDKSYEGKVTGDGSSYEGGKRDAFQEVIDIINNPQ